MANPIKYKLPALVIGRVYKSNCAPSHGCRDFYRIDQRLSEDFFRATTHTPGKKLRTCACSAKTLKGYALSLVDFDQEPEALQSEEGARLRAERKRASKVSRAPSTGGDKPRPVGVFLAAEVWGEVEAYAADQQRRADASGVEVKITMTEAIRCLVRKGLDAWRPEATATAAPTTPASKPAVLS